jgi:hypothetical protein
MCLTCIPTKDKLSLPLLTEWSESRRYLHKSDFLEVCFQDISGSHSSFAGDVSLLGCISMLLGGMFPLFKDKWCHYLQVQHIPRKSAWTWRWRNHTTWELLTQGYSVTSVDSQVPSYFLFNISHMRFIHTKNKSCSLLYIVENLDQKVYLLYKYSEVGVQVIVSIELCWQSYWCLYFLIIVLDLYKSDYVVEI